MNIENGQFTDKFGRTISLRGVNLSGSVKQPYLPYLPSHIRADFFESEQSVSFVNRPFPLIEADEHFARLRHWGFNFIRLNVTWEALEHLGPGLYDYDFIDYLVKILLKMREYGFKCFIDPHQDVWSRFSGGSGAPAWTFRLVGLEPRNFEATAAAIVHNTYSDSEKFPKMIWPTNYSKLACATMFTLFFAGRTFAPKCVIDGENVQDYLQRHYMNAICELIRGIDREPGLLDDVVVGYDTLNEPHHGYIGVHDITVFPPEIELRNGLTPTPFQSMLLGSGRATKIDIWSFGSFGPQKSGTAIIDPNDRSAWDISPFSPKYSFSHKPANTGCIWANHNIYDPKTNECLRPDYFSKDPQTGRKVEFLTDFWIPFVELYTKSIRAVHKNAIIFIEPPVNEIPPKMNIDRVCYAPHWYDGLTLMNKNFNPYFTVNYIGVKRGKCWSYVTALRFGEQGIKDCFKQQLSYIKDEGRQHIGNYPCILGEIGIPFDMNSKLAYKTHDYTLQTAAMDANMYALEQNLLHFTLWNYCSDNTHSHGDLWNGEDLSIFSRMKKRVSSFLEPVIHIQQPKQVEKRESMFARQTSKVEPMNFNKSSSKNNIDQSNEKKERNTKRDSGHGTMARNIPADLNIGGRALDAIVRPYAVYTAGTPISFSFNRKTSEMTYVFEQTSTHETEFYLPHLQYPDLENIVFMSDNGKFTLFYQEQKFTYVGDLGRRTVIVRNAKIGEVGGVKIVSNAALRRSQKRKSCCFIL